MFMSTLLFALFLNAFQSNAFQITYPKEGDLVNVYNGLVTTWSYNSSDSTLLPLTIQFVAVSHMIESPTYIQDDLNITLESTGTGTSSLAREFIHSTIVTSPLVPETTLASGPGAAATAATTHVSTSNENNDDGLSPGAKVGIGIGCAAAAIIGLVGLLLLYRIRKKGKPHPSEAPNLPSVDSTKLYGSSDTRKIFEADGKYESANMPELPSDHFTRSELPG
ncbi:uncharacterized protein N7473_006672 [Penicillium subrubescens]|uniref:uncharacterized protein n=1 Tax=Penicillium subrubescens TaxID=1316194 RepID=UPI00254520BD|nr:uncharacterized protein N7473_006672 [Penicillium subrubescens]KAJ5890444.1 hypothetical protein N7473_006672 [Penicillium subrubescens]